MENLLDLMKKARNDPFFIFSFIGERLGIVFLLINNLPGIILVGDFY